MARIRSIKPELFCHYELSECSIPARYLFMGLMCYADDFGAIIDNPRQIRLWVFPSDLDVDVDQLINELANNGRLIPFTAQGKNWLQIKGFQKHQKVDNPAIKARNPAFTPGSERSRVLASPSEELRGIANPIPDRRIEGSKEGSFLEQRTVLSTCVDPPQIEAQIDPVEVKGTRQECMEILNHLNAIRASRGMIPEGARLPQGFLDRIKPRVAKYGTAQTILLLDYLASPACFWSDKFLTVLNTMKAKTFTDHLDGALEWEASGRPMIEQKPAGPAPLDPIIEKDCIEIRDYYRRQLGESKVSDDQDGDIRACAALLRKVDRDKIETGIRRYGNTMDAQWHKALAFRAWVNKTVKELT
jgi:hypothetical protein